MKKLLLGAIALFLMASCSGNGTSEEAKEDSVRIADSIAQVEAAQAAAEQARLDSIAKVSAQYDELISQYVDAVNTVEKAAKKGQWNKMQSLCDKAQRLRNKIDKIKKDLTPEQSAKFKKAFSKWSRLLNGVIAG